MTNRQVVGNARTMKEMWGLGDGEKKKGLSRCICEIDIKTKEDLDEAIKQLRQHFATLQYTERSTIIEIWAGDLISQPE